MFTEYERAQEENDRPIMVWFPPVSLPLPLMALTIPALCLWRLLSKRQTEMGDYSLGMRETSDTYLTISHMVSDHLPLSFV
jgi:hypothetical protein